MRVLYVVDVHDRFEAVEKAVGAAGDVDVLLVGGDITTGGGPDDAQRAVERWRPLAPTLLAVAGNMDSPAIDARLAELGVSMHGRGVVVGDVGFAGASGSPHSPLHTPYELADDEFAAAAEAGLAELAGCRARILCPHAPPLDTACDRIRSGAHVGSAALRALIEREQPDLVLCGHIHESRGEDAIGDTRIANPGPAASGHYALVVVDDGISVELR